MTTLTSKIIMEVVGRALTYGQLENMYPYNEYYIAPLEIDSFATGTTQSYQVVHKKTGKYGPAHNELYEPDHIYYKEVAPGKYKQCDDPYARREPVKECLEETVLKNPKDAEIADKIRKIFKENGNTPLSQLALCKALGFQTYDMRATMVFRSMTISQELLVNRDQKPMTLYMNPNFKSGTTPPLSVVKKAPTEKKPSSNKAKMELAETIKNDMNRFLRGERADRQNAEINANNNSITISIDFRHLGRWESDFENSYYREREGGKDWYEDDDQMIWKDSKKYFTAFKNWVNEHPWKKFVSKIDYDTSEKSWCTFYVTLK